MWKGVDTLQNIKSKIDTWYWANRDDYDGTGYFYRCDDGSGGQNSIKVWAWKEANPGYLEMYKESADTSISSASSYYSLNGAQYGIWRESDGALVETMTTRTNGSKQGYAKSGALDPGWYWIHERVESNGFELDNEFGQSCSQDWNKAFKQKGWYRCYVNAGTTSPIKYNSTYYPKERPKTTGLKIQKVDNTGATVRKSGFKFSLYGPNSKTKLVGSKTTGPSGTVEFDGLAIGATYYIKETAVPDNTYILNTSMMTVKTNSSTSVKNVEFENEKRTTGTVTVQKKDATTNANLGSGFTFVLRQNGDTKYTAHTDRYGVATFENVKFGTYTLAETSAKAPYIINTQTVSVTLSASNYSVSKNFTNDKLTGEITLTKVDSDNSNRPIQGAKFALYADENIRRQGETSNAYDAGELVLQKTTDSRGKITWTDLPIGSDGSARYRIEEVSVPSPYICSGLPKTIDLVRSGSQSVVYGTATVGNEQAHGEVSLIKKDEKGNLVEGAKFELRAAENVVVNGQTIYTNNQLIDTLTTGADGKISKGNLPIGNDGSTTYKFVEKSVPASYVKQGNGTYNVTLNHDGHSKTVKASVNAINDIATASIKIIKQDQDDAAIKVEGAKFDVHAVDDVLLPNGDKLVSAGDKVGSITTNASGEATIEGLYVSAEGTDYSFTETYVPAPYEKETTPIIVTVKYKDMNTPVVSATKTIENHKLQGKLTVTKTDSETDRPIQGVVFDIIADEDIIRDDEPEPLIKKDEVAATITTGADGTASYGKLPIGSNNKGKYRVVEKDAPKPYVVDPTPRHIEFVRQGDEATILYGMEWENTPQEGHVILHKKDTLDNVVEGVTFDVYATEDVVVNGETIYRNNQKIDTLTTDDTGMLDIDGIAIGDDGDTQLKFVEVSAPVPYVKQGTGEYPITLKFKNGVAKVDGEIEATNDIATAQIDITKLDDDTDDPIEGAVFDVYARETVSLPNGDVLVEKDEKVGTITTNAEGKASIDNLYVDEDGTPYEFVETSVPRPYVIPQETTTVTVKYKDINTAHVTASATITNMTTPGIIDVIKDDSETHKPVEGAIFDIIANEDIRINGKLIHQKGDKVGTVTTDEDGRASTKYLKLGDDGDGKYIVREVSVPSPYIISGSPDHEITINYDPEATEAIHVECPVTDDIVTGKASLHKSDDETGEAIAGAVFDVVATEQIKLPNGHVFHEKDDVVDTITTDENGDASIDHLYVGDDGDGQYKFVEKSVPMPYIITNAETPFTITQSDMTTAVVSVSKDIKNDIAKGKATITKTDDGTGRKLAGAKFDVVAREDIEYPNGDVKVANGTVVETVTTNENGQATTSELLIGADGDGKYAFVEVEAPEGYLLDPTDVPFTLIYDEDNPLVSVNATKTDNPICGGVEMPKIDTELSKYDGQEDETGNPQGNATVEGAVFDIISLNDYEVVVDGNKFSKDEVVKTITTNEDGIASTSNECLQHGDYKLVEKRAPEGYKLTDEEWEFSIELDGVIVKPADVAARIDNQVIRGGVEMPKVDAELISEDVVGDAAQTDEEDNPQGDATVDGAEFSITNRSTHHVIVGGKLYEPGETITTIPRGVGGEDGETYETIITVDGVASTTANALPYGTYEIKEVKAPEGYLLNTADSWTFTITEDGKTVRPSTASDKIEDTPIRGGVAMPKVDTELSQFAGDEQKEGNPQGDATVEGAEFTIRNESQSQVVVNGKVYESGQDVITIRTGADGIATTGNLALPYGSYTIREVKEPTGYLPSTTNHDGDDGEVWSFEIRENGKIVRPAIDDVEHKIDNQVIRGDVEMPKIDTELSTYSGQEDATNNPQGGATVSGAEFTIKNKSAHHVIVNGKLYQPEEDVAKIVTGDDGIARTTGKALPYGTYELRETKAPEGYHLTTETFTFSIRNDGEVVKPADVDSKIDNQIIRGGVAMPKVDSEFSTLVDGGDMDEDFIADENHPQGDASVDGAEFSITNVSGHHVIVGGVLYDDGARITTIPDANRTDKYYDTIITVNGIASTTDDALPYGTYELREVKQPTGYLESSVNHDDDDNGEVWTFTISEEGVIVRPDKENDVESKIDNQVIRGGVEMPKVDSELSEYNKDGNDQRANESNPQGDATVKGATFSLTNVSAHEVYVGGQVYDGKGSDEHPDGERIMTIPVDDEGNVSDVITTDDDGIARTTIDALSYGTYELREVDAPDGYHHSSVNHDETGDGEVWTFEIRENGKYVRPDKVEEVEEKIDNQVIRGGVSMPKIDTEFSTLVNGEDMEEDFITDENHPQGDATVDGAEFSITNVSAGHVIVGGKLYEPGSRIETIPDANRGGELHDTIITVDGIASTTDDALPYGTYELREVKQPDGYHESSLNHDDDASGEVWTFTIRQEGVIVRPNKETEVEDKIDNQVIRGGVEMPKIDTEISKYDGQEDESNPQGDATLEGATFSLTNVSKNEVYVGGQVYASGERITTIPDGNADGTISDVITTDADGIARTTEDALPYGTYELREVKQPDGYNHSSFNHKGDESGEVYTFTIRTEDEIARPDKEDGVEDKIDNRVIRGGVRLPKLDADLSNIEGYEDKENQPTGDATLDGAEFAIDNASKSHVIVGGKLYESGERITSIPDGNKDGKTASVIVTVEGVAQTTADALPYGTYEIYEVKAPEGYELSTDRFTFTIREEGVIVQPTDEDGKAAIKDQSTTTETGGIKIDAELSRYADDVAAGNDDQTDEEQNGDESTEGTEDAEESAVVDTLAFDDAQPSANAAGIDMNPLTNAQGDATLEGAEFSLTNRSKDIVVIGGKVYKPGERITTIPLPDGTYGDVVKSDATGYIDFGDEGLPYGTYELAEVKAPYGYNLSDDTWVVTVHGDKNTNAIPRDYAEQKATSSSPEVVPETKDEAIEDDVIRGGLSVQKVDKETGRGDTIVTGIKSNDDKADSDESADDANIDAQADEASDGDNVNDGSVELGDDVENGSSDDADASGDAEFHNASLAGTMFEIRNASDKAVIVDGKLYQVGQVVKTITTDESGYAETAADALPFGTYDVYESSAPNGYISSADSYGNSDGKDDDDEKAYVQTVEIREQGVIVPCARPFANQIKRGDITFTKIDDDGNVMPHVAFKVTSKTTGESHIIVTDENGVFNSSSAVIPHSRNTNGNDGAFDKKGNIKDDALAYDAGLWFYGNADGKAFEGDGTLPNNVDRFGFDAENNESVDGNVDADDAVADDTSDDASGDDGLVLGDDIENGSGSSAGSSDEPAHVNPVYEVTDDGGETKQVTIGYVPTDDSGSFDKNSVVFNADGSVTIVYDSTVVDAETGERRSYTSYETYADGSWKVIVTGSDMLDDANADGIADADGNGEYDIVDNHDAYTTSSQYPMRSVDDNLGAFPYDEYIFEELPSKATEGRNLVVFEASIQRHNYVLNLGPITDNIIDIRTTATDQSDGDHILTTDEKVTIVDRVEYTNLNTDREYTMTGTLMDYETGEPMTDANGNAITSSVTFKPESPNGSVDIVFEIDASQLGGVRGVVFEDLYWNNIHIASHADIEDKNQLVEFHPEIGTIAVGDQTNDHYVYDDGSVIIVDTVHYKGLVPGREFIVHGILMDKNTGDALVDANGETVENSVVFTPETSEGDVQVLFEFDASTLAGLDIVAFENLYRIDTVTNRQPDENVNDDDEVNGQPDDLPATQRLVASHADINDASQTVSVRASGLAADQIANDLVQTGAIVGIGIAAAAAAGGAAYQYNKKRKQIADAKK